MAGKKAELVDRRLEAGATPQQEAAAAAEPPAAAPAESGRATRTRRGA